MRSNPQRRFPALSLAVVAVLLLSTVPTPVGAAPVITGISDPYPTTPDSDPSRPDSTTNGGTLVTISGSGFESDSTVTFGGVAAAIVGTPTGSTINVIAPPQTSAGTVNVVVTNPSDGSTFQFTNAFVYRNAGTPTLTGATPSAGTANGGTTVTISGTNLFFSDHDEARDTAFRIGDHLPAEVTRGTCSGLGDGVTFVCTTATVVMPAHAQGAKDIVVTNPDGKSATRMNGFTYDQPIASTIDTITPDNGNGAGGLTVTIAGANFAADSVVRIGGTVAASTFVSGTQITAVTPPNSGGLADVSVTSPSGQTTTRDDFFTYVPATNPDATGLSGALQGPTTGGSRVTILGSNFHDDAQVTFGNVPAEILSVTQGSPDAIVVKSPPHAAGNVPVRVTNPDGKTDALSNAFEYRGGVVITAVSPLEGHRHGGYTLTVIGSGFVSGATVFIDGEPALATSLSGNTLSAVVPPSAQGTFGGDCYDSVTDICRIVDVRVQNPSGDEATLVNGFAYRQAAEPTASKICTTSTSTCTAAPSGTENGGNRIFIHGTNFHASPVPRVTFGGDAEENEGTIVNVASGGTWIEVIVPPSTSGTGAVDVVIENAGSVENAQGRTVTMTGGYTYTDSPAPTISSLSSNTDTRNGGKTITINGNNFHTSPKPVVEFGTGLGAVEAEVGTVTGSTIQVTVPPRASTGMVDIIVRNPGGDENPNLLATTANDFTYTSATAPSITTLSPTAGSALGGQTITIAGTNFHVSPRPTVTFGTVEAVVTSVTTNSQSGASTMSVVVPASAVTGAVDVTVENPGGQDVTKSDAFAYTAGASPTPTGVSPSSGPATGGTELTITGTNFAQPGAEGVPKPTVTIGGVAVLAADVTVVSDTQLRVITPDMTTGGLKTISVTNPGGGSGSLGGAFTALAALDPPTVSATPTACGSTNGAASRVFAGGDFQPGAAVLVNGVPSRPLADADSDAATFEFQVPPSLTAGFRTLTLLNPDGQSVGVFRACEVVGAPAPRIDDWSPPAGPASGGTVLTIDGANFAPDGLEVLVGGFAATILSASTTQIEARVPAHSSGVSNIVVTNPDTKSATAEDAFGFVGAGGPAAATVTSVSPNSGPSLGGTSVTITGTGFATGATVTFGGVAATSVVRGSASSITAVTPPHAVGAVDVVVTNPGASAGTLNDGFTYTASNPPTVSSVTPDEGSTNGGTSVTIAGTNFANGATVSFGGTEATSVTFTSSTSLTAVTPARTTAGAVDVTVTNPDDQEDTLDDGFTYEAAPPPTVTSLSPQQGPSVGGTSVTIVGTGLSDGATVSFGGRDSPTVAVASNGNSLTATTPGHPAGSVSLVVTNPDGQSASVSGAFTYTPSAAPTITSVTPTTGPTAGGTAISITGTGFADGASVRIGAAAATDVTVTSATQITARTPPGTSGAKDVQVINPDDQTATLANAFTYGTGSSPSTAQIAAANERLQDSVDVSRDGDDNVITFSLSGISPAPQGIQVWRSTSPFVVIAELTGTQANAGEYVDEGAPSGAYYILTVFYSRDAAGGFVDTLSDAPGYEGTTEEEQQAMAAQIGTDGGIPWVVWLIGGLVLLAIIVVVIVVVATRRRAPERDDRQIGWVDEDWDALPPEEPEEPEPTGPVQTFHITCPRCHTDFDATGTKPLTTHCPSCGVEGTLR